MRTFCLVFLLLVCSNLFMTFAWYGHLKNLAGKPIMGGGSGQLGIAFFEYVLQVPANRLGHEVMTVGQLKILQRSSRSASSCVLVLLHAREAQLGLPVGRTLLARRGLLYLRSKLFEGVKYDAVPDETVQNEFIRARQIRKRPVKTSRLFGDGFGGPHAIISPPLARPLARGRSANRKPRIKSRLCSITITVFASRNQVVQDLQQSSAILKVQPSCWLIHKVNLCPVSGRASSVASLMR